MPIRPEPVSDTLFRTTLARFASGVTVITSTHGEDIAGTTVSAFSSLSLDPPLVLVCLDETSATRELIERSRVFAVNILARGQGELSDRFAKRRKEGDPHQFEGVGYDRAPTRSPILHGCHAFADCRVVAVHEGGDHRIYVGRVDTLGVDDGPSEPLVYHAGRLRPLGN
jgi:flavin reductase (DIM6/NTAB) family NADH-FMN oxidoreductase RutF